MSTSSQTSEEQPERLPADATEKLLKAIFGTGNPPPGGGGSGLEIRLSAVETRAGQVETRLAVVETKLGALEAGVNRVEAVTLRLQDNARTDFRLIFGALIATALGLAGMMAKGFHWI